LVVFGMVVTRVTVVARVIVVVMNIRGGDGRRRRKTGFG
jgi:hypothetical protein